MSAQSDQSSMRDKKVRTQNVCMPTTMTDQTARTMFDDNLHALLAIAHYHQELVLSREMFSPLFQANLMSGCHIISSLK